MSISWVFLWLVGGGCYEWLDDDVGCGRFGVVGCVGVCDLGGEVV